MPCAIHEERCMHCRCVHRVVDGNFEHRQELALTRKRVYISLKCLVEDAVCILCLIIWSGWSDVDIINRVPSERNTDCQESAVNRESRSDISSRSRPWNRNIVSIKKWAQPLSVIEYGTATRWNILLNRLANTWKRFFEILFGKSKMKSSDTYCQHFSWTAEAETVVNWGCIERFYFIKTAFRINRKTKNDY